MTTDASARNMSFLDHLQSRLDHLSYMLSPFTEQIYLIRTSVLSASTSLCHHQRDSFAHGGQILTDMAIIQNESDHIKTAELKTGFANLYGLEYRQKIRSFPKVVEIANIYADLQTKIRDMDMDMDAVDRDKYLQISRMILGT